MTSKNSDPTLERIIRALRDDATAARDEESEESKFAQLDEIFAQLQSLLEAEGEKRELLIETQKFVSDLREEQKDLRRMRWGAVVVSTLFSLGFSFSAFYSIIFNPPWLSYLTNSQVVYFIGALVGAAMFSFSVVAKGVFASRSERHKEQMLSPAVQQLLEVSKQMRS